MTPNLSDLVNAIINGIIHVKIKIYVSKLTPFHLYFH